MLVFLFLNEIDLNFTHDELVELGISLASGIMDQEKLLKWIIKKS